MTHAQAEPADAELLLRLYEIRREPELRKARAWFLTEFKPASWAEIKARYLSHDDPDRWFRMTTSYWELVGTLVNRGALHPELFFDHTGEDVVTWDAASVHRRRARDIRPTYLYQFERLVRTTSTFAAHHRGLPAGASSRNGAGDGGRARRPRAPRRTKAERADVRRRRPALRRHHVRRVARRGSGVGVDGCRPRPVDPPRQRELDRRARARARSRPRSGSRPGRDLSGVFEG